MSAPAKLVAMIPARIGSTRLKMKNLALIGGKPLISYAIEAAQASGVFDRVILNSDSPVFGEIASRYGAELYLRPPELGSSTAKSDSVVNDFMAKHPARAVAWVNPTSPLQTAAEVKAAAEHFLKEGLDTLITVRDQQVHSVYQGQPVNFRLEEPFAQTQDLQSVQTFVYSVMMWRCETFLAAFRAKGHAVFCGKVGYFPVSKETAIIIKTDEDLRLADHVLKARSAAGRAEIAYDEAAGRAG